MAKAPLTFAYYIAAPAQLPNSIVRISSLRSVNEGAGRICGIIVVMDGEYVA